MVWSGYRVGCGRRHPPHHLSPAKQTTRQGVIPKGASTAPQPAQQRSDQGRKPVISEQDSCSLAWIIALMRGLSRERSSESCLPRPNLAAARTRPAPTQTNGSPTTILPNCYKGNRSCVYVQLHILTLVF